MIPGQHIIILEPTQVFARYETAEILKVEKGTPQGDLLYVYDRDTDKAGFIPIKDCKLVSVKAGTQFKKTTKRQKKCPTCKQLLPNQ